jgi:hypothetical protein
VAVRQQRSGQLDEAAAQELRAVLREGRHLLEREPAHLHQPLGLELLVGQLAAGRERLHVGEVVPLLLPVVPAADVEDVRAVGHARPALGQVQADLLAELAAYGVRVALAGLDPAAGHTPDAATVVQQPTDHQHPLRGIDEDDADRGAEVEGGGHPRRVGDRRVRCWRTEGDTPWKWRCLRLGSGT